MPVVLLQHWYISYTFSFREWLPIEYNIDTGICPCYVYIFIILRMWRLRVSQIEEKDSYLTLTHNSSSLTTLTTKYILADPKIREIFSYIISYEEPLSLNSGNNLIYRYILLCKKYEKRLNPVQCWKDDLFLLYALYVC